MSQLRLTSNTWGSRYLNVLSFSAPVTGMIDNAQTRTLQHHFPIKALQPELELEVVFANEKDYENFQTWVRNVQIDAQNNQISPGVTIWWPQRSIYDWTGLIKKFEGGGRRANYTPRAKFTIDLVDSMVSSRTTLSSLASNIEEIWGINTPGGILGSGVNTHVSDSLLAQPEPIKDNVSTGGEVVNALNIPPGPIINSSIDGGGGQGGGGGGGGSF